jgi:ligand-binding SRPBCC domain-containing protein
VVGGLHEIDRAQLVPLPVEEAFAFFADAFNLEAITPPWLRFRILTPRPIAMGEGAMIDYRLQLHHVPCRWHTRIETWVPGRRFVDRQLSGPFSRWEHTHTFESRPEGTLIRDLVVYQMPLGPLGELARRLLIGRDLERIFDYRCEAVERLLGAARPSQSEKPGGLASSG